MDAQTQLPPDGNQNRTGPIIGMMIGALILSCTFVALRMFTRFFILKSVWWDDWTIVLALVLCESTQYHTSADRDEAWNYCWHWSRFSRGPWRICTSPPSSTAYDLADSVGSTSTLSYRSPIPRIQEIYLWRMDSNFLHTDVYEGIGVSAAAAHLS